MTVETDLQTELKKAAISVGGFSFKMSNRFLVGVPDLFIQLPHLPTVILEVKYAKKPLKNGTVWVELTSHQERYVKEINKAGGVAGWIMITKIGIGEYAWHVGRAPLAAYIQAAVDCRHVRHKGEQWPIDIIIGEILSCS